MNKKLLSVLLALSLSCSCVLTACSNGPVEEPENSVEAEIIASDYVVVTEPEPALPTPIPESMQPDLVQVRNICQLATLRVYFHNVAKAIKPRANGLSGIGESDREFWVEYSGYAEIGIDMSRVTMEFTGDNEITVTLPPVELIGGVHVDSSSYDYGSIIVADENWYNILNENVITAEDMTGAINDANLELQTEIMSNNTLLMSAEKREEDLITNYIQQVAKHADTTYTVVFVHTSEE